MPKSTKNSLNCVHATLTGLKAITEFTTLADGKFSFSGLNYGEYDLTITKSGFHKYTTTVKIIEGGSSVTLSCSLSNPYNALYGGFGFDWLGKSAIAVDSDGTLWLGGQTKSSDGDLQGKGYHDGYDACLFHIVSDGETILSKKCFGGSDDDYANSNGSGRFITACLLRRIL